MDRAAPPIKAPPLRDSPPSALTLHPRSPRTTYHNNTKQAGTIPSFSSTLCGGGLGSVSPIPRMSPGAGHSPAPPLGMPLLSLDRVGIIFKS